MSQPASACGSHPQPRNSRVGTSTGATCKDMQELYRLLWSTYPMCFSELPSTLQTLPSKQRIIQGTVSPAITRPVLNCQYHRIPGAIFSVFTTKLLCMVLFQLSSSQLCSLSVLLSEDYEDFYDNWIKNRICWSLNSSLLTMYKFLILSPF